MIVTLNGKPVLESHRIDQTVLERLRNDPEVEVRTRDADGAVRFIPKIRVTSPIDELDLIGRHDEDADAPTQR
jgi:hypothetical protein